MKRSHTQGVMGLLMLLAGSLAVAEDGVHRFEASTQDYNRLVLPEPYSQIVIPPEAQLRDNPVPTDGRRGILFRPAVDAERSEERRVGKEGSFGGEPVDYGEKITTH